MANRKDNDRSNNNWPVDVPGVFDIGPVELPALPDVTDEVESLLAGSRPDSDRIEAALSDIEAPELDDIKVNASTVSGTTPISADDADAIVETGEDTVAVSVEAGTETANVLLDAGEEAIEVVVEDGGEIAAEAVAEVLTAALEGV